MCYQKVHILPIAGNYWDFQKWSVDNYAEVWAQIYDFFGVIHSKKYYRVSRVI